MRLKIIETNFTTKYEWIFSLVDENGNRFYIMNGEFYKNHNFKSPITKKELDTYDKGQWITAKVEKINGNGIVIG